MNTLACMPLENESAAAWLSRTGLAEHVYFEQPNRFLAAIRCLTLAEFDRLISTMR